MSRPVLSNAAARRLFLDRHALLSPPSGAGRGAELSALVERLGFVQVDSVNTLARAHDLILWSRMGRYRPAALERLVRARAAFEHWTHDAAVIPMSFFPHWRLKFDRDRAHMDRRWTAWQGDDYRARFDAVLEKIAETGPCTAAEAGADEAKSSGGWWDWHPSKAALEYLWRAGELAICHREGFRKHYDLTERVVPPEVLNARPAPEETVDWACNGALDRLGVATPGEIASFWEIPTRDEVAHWCRAARAGGLVEEVEVEGADGRRRVALARPGTVEEAEALPAPGQRMRLLSPFDPALRDRARAERLFGFRYRIEIFVPEAKRRFGYYVFPVMEGARIAGRIDMKADRAAGRLAVRAYWPEAGMTLGKGREARLMAELERVAGYAGLGEIEFAEGWRRGVAHD